MKFRIILSIISLICFYGINQAAASAATGANTPGTIVVDSKGGQYSSIQAAVDDAEPGDTVLIKPGIYRERIKLQKPVRLIGESYPEINGGGQGDVITLLAGNSSVVGLLVSNSGSDLTKDEAGIKVKSNHNVITGNKLEGNAWGIYLYAANDNVISHNFVNGRTSVQQSSRGNGIHLWKSDRNLCDSNELVANRDALYLSFANHNIISNNMAYNQRYGIHYMYSNYNKVEKNVLHDNKGGIAMMNSNFNQVRLNRTFRNNNDGILLKDLDNNLVEGNISYNNRQGIFMYNSNQNKVLGNQLAANSVGLNLAAGSDDNLFITNCWVNNQYQVQLTDPLKNRWNDQKQGNYWSDYTGYDLDKDGIGDYVYWQNQLIENLVKDFPVIKLLFNSPAIQFVRAAEKALPVLRTSGVIDNFPLMQITKDLKGFNIDWQKNFVDDENEAGNSSMDESHNMDEHQEMDMH